MKEKDKTYTITDIARYHSGTMPASEMHELEKAALGDPFLEDALEGYVHTSSFENDIKELANRLIEKRKKKNVFSLSALAENQWWRIAALFIVISGAGYLFYQMNSGSKNNPLAKNEVKATVEKGDSTSINKPGSAIPQNDSSFENQQAFTPEQNKKMVLPPAKTPINKGYFDTVGEDKVTSKENIPERDMVYEKDKPIPLAGISDKPVNEMLLTDTAGRFRLRSKDSNILATASVPGFSRQSSRLTKEAPPTITINKSETALNKVAVNGYSTQRKANLIGSTSKELINGDSIFQAVEFKRHPFRRQEIFDQYLEDNIPGLYDSTGVKLAGEVSLSFTINKKGKPRNIKVIKSSCSACEKEAVKLLENGPKWVSRGNEQETVDIKF